MVNGATLLAGGQTTEPPIAAYNACHLLVSISSIQSQNIQHIQQSANGINRATGLKRRLTLCVPQFVCIFCEPSAPRHRNSKACTLHHVSVLRPCRRSTPSGPWAARWYAANRNPSRNDMAVLHCEGQLHKQEWQDCHRC